MNKNRKPLIIALLLSVTLLGSSCFNITEEYFFRKDGSGTAKVIFDISQMVSMMEMMGDMGGDSTDMPSMDELFQDDSFIKELEGMDGISNVKNLTDKEQKVIGYSYDFESVEALNRTITDAKGPNLGGEASGMGMSSNTGGGATFTLTKKGLVRDYPKPEPMEETSEADMGMVKAIMGEAAYTVTYKFEQGIKKVKAKNSEVTEQDDNSVTLKTNLMDMVEGQKEPDVAIKLKK